MTLTYRAVKSMPSGAYSVLAGIKVGDKFSRIDLVSKNPDHTYRQIQTQVDMACKDGVIRLVVADWYDGMSTVTEWRASLSRTKWAHADPGRRGTRDTYSRALGRFERWLSGRTFDVVIYKDGYTVQEKVSFSGVEEMVRYLAGPVERTRHIQGIIKRYLHDPIHEGKKASTIKIIKNAILSYLTYHDFDIHLKFDAKKVYDSEVPQKEFTLSDMQTMLQTANRRDRAILACKFQRGLDLSTLTDVFNYEAFGQISDYYNTTDYTQWDPGRCPIPIKLRRVKTKYMHMGFIDVDALTSVISYLKQRVELGHKFGRDLPLFVTKRSSPVSTNAVIHIFEETAKRAGLRDGPVKVGSHEVRDLLKSTLINAGCRYDVADHVIGHKPKDSYEKQASLYPDTVRAEYGKASKWINVLSRSASVINAGGDSQADLEGRMKKLEAEAARRDSEQQELIRELRDMLSMTARQKVDSLR